MRKYIKVKWFVLLFCILVASFIINSSGFWSFATLYFGSKHYSAPVAEANIEPGENTVTFDFSNRWLAGYYTVYIASERNEYFTVQGRIVGDFLSPEKFTTQAAKKTKIVTFDYDLIHSFRSKTLKLAFESEIPDDSRFFIVRSY